MTTYSVQHLISQSRWLTDVIDKPRVRLSNPTPDRCRSSAGRRGTVPVRRPTTHRDADRSSFNDRRRTSLGRSLSVVGHKTWRHRADLRMGGAIFWRSGCQPVRRSVNCQQRIFYALKTCISVLVRHNKYLKKHACKYIGPDIKWSQNQWIEACLLSLSLYYRHSISTIG